MRGLRYYNKYYLERRKDPPTGRNNVLKLQDNSKRSTIREMIFSINFRDIMLTVMILLLWKLLRSGIIKISYNARNINDASWSRFLQMLDYKAASAGIQLVRVEPRGTTQTCSGCGKVEESPKKLWNRIHKCSYCGLTLDRDHNAAINILNRALSKIGQELSEVKPLREETDTDKTDKKFRQQIPLMKEEATDFNRR